MFGMGQMCVLCREVENEGADGIDLVFFSTYADHSGIRQIHIYLLESWSINLS